MEWTRGHTLGRGSTATVSIASRYGRVFAVKSAELHQSESLKREQGILSTVFCPQIVAYKGCDVTLENGALLYNVFMEYAPHGTLADAARRHEGRLSEPLAGCYTRQILLGLNYLHSNGIVHCDLKGQNVLVTEQGAKIADLGCARRVADSAGVIAGTPAFMAPEVARGEQQGFPADVWALGCTVLEMVTGEAPWRGVSDPVSALYRIGFSGEEPEIPSYVSEEVKDFLGRCLKRDPCERWTARELLGHEFVGASTSGFDWCDLETPTSVLDQGFWETLEAEQGQTATRGCCSLNSAGPRDRIRGLCAGPDWEWDHHAWITVRSVAEAEAEAEAEENEKTEDCGSGPVCCIVREENSSVVCDEPKSNLVITIGTGLGSWSDNISDCYFSGCCITIGSLYGFPCINIVPQGKIDSQNKQFFSLICFLLSLPPPPLSIHLPEQRYFC